MGASLYVHVPFCYSRCSYCDFYHVDYASARVAGFLDAVAMELDALPRGWIPSTIYVGGGTPTALRDAELERLLGLLLPFRGPDQEFTFEANPSSTTMEKARLLRDAGVTRVSCGVQSFRDATLEMLGRIHRREHVAQAWKILRENVPSLGLDLIFAVPGTDLADWNDDLSAALCLGPEHVSAYALTYAPGTDITGRRERAEFEVVPEEEERSMFLATIDRLTAAGYEHYEISNYARPGQRSRHNEGYWMQQDYRGVGPGACTTVGDLRYVNLPDVRGYVRGILDTGAPPRQEERLSEKDRSNESILLGLRTAAGLSLAEFRSRAGKDLDAYSSGSLGRLVEGGYLVTRGDRLALTREGLCVADRVISELMA